MCNLSVFTDSFYVFPCLHAFHRQCIVNNMTWHQQFIEKESANEGKDKRDSKMFENVIQIVNLNESIEDYKSSKLLSQQADKINSMSQIVKSVFFNTNQSAGSQQQN